MRFRPCSVSRIKPDPELSRVAFLCHCNTMNIRQCNQHICTKRSLFMDQANFIARTVEILTDFHDESSCSLMTNKIKRSKKQLFVQAGRNWAQQRWCGL